MIFVQPVMRDHLSWETAFAGQKGWSPKTGSTVVSFSLDPTICIRLVSKSCWQWLVSMFFSLIYYLFLVYLFHRFSLRAVAPKSLWWVVVQEDRFSFRIGCYGFYPLCCHQFLQHYYLLCHIDTGSCDIATHYSYCEITTYHIDADKSLGNMWHST